MKKYIFISIMLLVLFTPITYINAQFRPFLTAVDPDGAGTGGEPGILPVTDRFGNPTCCENGNNELDLTLSFNNFTSLIALQNALAAAQRDAANEWLRNQENTLRMEINRQLGENYSSFETAQKEYFKFYEDGGGRNIGVIDRMNSLSSNQRQFRNSQQEIADKNLEEYAALDSWIKCGFCGEHRNNAFELANLEQYDIDTSPGPKFFSTILRDTAEKAFG